MEGLFKNCGALNYLDLSNFNTSNVTNMQYMFMNCGSLQSLDLSAFDMSKVIKADTMFCNDKNLRTIYATADWSLANGASSGGMFVYCDNLVGGSGTSYAIQHNDAVYARIDDPNHGKPGYFTLKTN